MENTKNWKLKLRYGKETTPFTHFTVIADGIMEQKDNDFDCPLGTCVMSIKVWATDATEADDMIKVIGKRIGFIAHDNIEVYDTEADEPPKDKPYGYFINFIPYDENE